MMRLNLGTNWHVVRKELNGALKPSAAGGEIWYGGNSGYKNSLDKNYLKLAEATGKVKIQTQADVTGIHEDGDGFTISYNQISDNGEVLSKRRIRADYLFMGAGSMGTSALLTRAKYKKTLPRLNDEIGKHWGNNGDTFAVHTAGLPTRHDEGGPAHFVALDYEDNPYGPQSMIAFPKWDSPSETITFLGMAIPKQSGYWDYDEKADKARLHWAADSKATKELVAGMEYTCAKFDNLRNKDPNRSGAVPREARVTKADASTTAHPCGGAVMGKACDLYGRVKGYRRLYVVDGAFIPLGTAAANPALTIAAFAERSMDHIIQNDF
jgi:cholesterol oxidase